MDVAKIARFMWKILVGTCVALLPTVAYCLHYREYVYAGVFIGLILAMAVTSQVQYVLLRKEDALQADYQ